MKKFIVLLAVVALTLISSMAFAEISVSGAIDTRSWNVVDLDHNDQAADRNTRTQTRVQLIVDGKAGDAAKARIQLENDWDNWGRFETPMANATGGGTAGFFDLREAWVDVKLPADLHLRGGHQLLQLGQGWFFRSMKYGSDAWVMYKDIDALHLGLVDVKISEGTATATDDDDAYVVVATYKMSDTMKVGVDIADVKFRQTGAADPNEMMNIGANFTGKIGPVSLNAEVDLQTGDNGAATAVDYSGMQMVAQASIPMDPVTINVTLGYGTGDDPATADENEGYVNYLDANQHYATIYEYLSGQPGGGPAVGVHRGFANLLAIGAGVAFKVSPTLTLGADLWKLDMNETAAGVDSDLGMEIDLKINWKLADNVTWNWQIAQHMVGDAYGTAADDATAIIGILGMKF